MNGSGSSSEDKQDKAKMNGKGISPEVEHRSEDVAEKNGNGSSPEDEHQKEDVVIIDIKDDVDYPYCCIYKVPIKLRNINKDAYTPYIVSIGPYHHNKKEWDDPKSKKEWKWDVMQKQKKRYREKFKEQICDERFKKINKFIEDEEKRILDCYEATFKVDNFKEMILDDALFIVELFWRNYHDVKRDFLLSKPWLTNAVKLDLQLLENQLPYFLLEELYTLAYVNSTREVSPSFLTLSCKFFGYKGPDGVAERSNNIKHFVDLRRHSMLAQTKSVNDKSYRQSPGGKIEDLPSAVKLNESGVKFTPVENRDAVLPGESGENSKSNKEKEKSLLDITYRRREDSRIPWLRENVLEIPRVKIEDGTECLFRNLMALEQCLYPSATHICNYINLMDTLINTRKDVDLLVEKGIISNCVGDHDSIKEMFNKLCLEITTSPSYYQLDCQRLIEQHKKWWNRTKATLMSVYFENLWRGTGTVAAAILLFLTVLQTIQRFFPELFQH